MVVFADVAVAPIILFAGFITGMMAFVPIVLIESLVFWRLKWGSFGRSLADSALINVASTFCGLVLFIVFTLTAFQCIRFPVDAEGHLGTECSWLVPPLLGLVALWALTVAIEGGVLLLLKRHTSRQTWIAALAGNVASYALVGLGIAILGPGFR